MTKASVVSVHCFGRKCGVPVTITIDDPSIVALIEAAADRFTAGNKTEVVVLALRCLLEQDPRVGTLFGVNRGSVWVREGVDLTKPSFDELTDAETGRELEHRWETRNASQD
jgi:hypothetical protein